MRTYLILSQALGGIIMIGIVLFSATAFGKAHQNALLGAFVADIVLGVGPLFLARCKHCRTQIFATRYVWNNKDTMGIFYKCPNCRKDPFK